MTKTFPLFKIGMVIATTAMAGLLMITAAAAQQSFKSPDEAAQALIAALRPVAQDEAHQASFDGVRIAAMRGDQPPPESRMRMTRGFRRRPASFLWLPRRGGGRRGE